MRARIGAPRTATVSVSDEFNSKCFDKKLTTGYSAEPLAIDIHDDWSSLLGPGGRDTPLQLSFTVRGQAITALATVSTVPKLMSYLAKFRSNMEHQRLGAIRESKTFRVSQSSVPENPLSSVANAMLLSAREKFSESHDVFSFLIQQHLSLSLEVLKVAIFPRSMRDPEVAQFDLQDVQAVLNRTVASDSSLISRDIHLSFSSISIAKFSHLNRTGIASKVHQDALLNPDTSVSRTGLSDLLRNAHEATIVGLPSMTMEMSSREKQLEQNKRELHYRFVSRFIRREDIRDLEDIFITLNMSLYTWLTTLRKNLARELDQIQAVTKRDDSTDHSATTGLYLSEISPTLSPINTTISSTGGISLTQTSKQSGPSVLLPAEPSALESLDTQKPIVYIAEDRNIERLNMRQLGGATPDVMHPFFMKASLLKCVQHSLTSHFRMSST